MTLSNHKVAWTTFLLVILAFSAVSVSFGLQSSSAISSSGMISYWPRVDITVNASKVIGVNNLSLGFQLDWYRWHYLIDRSEFRQLARDINVKLIRIFDFRKTTPNLMPCTRWRGTAATSDWSWIQVDALTDAIFNVGAEPLYCLGFGRSNIQNYIPTGMPVNSTTQLPDPEQYADYCAEWVRHFKQRGTPVRFYQIMNEPGQYFGWAGENTAKVGYFIELWNIVARAMRQENPNILVGNDASMIRRVLDYWLQHGDDIDYLDFHKYEGALSDAECFNHAEQMYINNAYSIAEAKQKWLSSRGVSLDIVVNSESNLNAAWEGGTDPRMQQMAGAVWLALLLRAGMVQGLTHNVYFEFCSSRSWQESQGTGWGFGMVNEDDNKPWYPYYVHKMIGSNLAIGDSLIQTQSSSDDIRTIGWIHNGKIKILLVCKVDQPRTVSIMGIPGEMNAFWIDASTPADNPSIQTGPVNATQPITLKGYTVMLIQSP